MLKVTVETKPLSEDARDSTQAWEEYRPYICKVMYAVAGVTRRPNGLEDSLKSVLTVALSFQ
jgi:hypothetical protein